MNVRIPVFFAVSLALLAFAPVAGAQRASLAERVAALEQRAATDQGNVDLLNQVNALKSDVQALRAQIEELQHKQQQMEEAGRNQYLDLDGRINRLEGGAAVAPPADATGGAAAVAPQAPARTAASTGAPATAAPSAVPPPRATTVAAPGDAERVAYEAAFDRLKAGRYDESARAFQQFLGQFPAGPLAPNAVYWLGESYYATQNYELAAQQFRALLERYPAHDKAAGAMLKLGLSQYGLGQQDAAQATLAQVVRSYPGTDAARTAQDRLQAMRLTSAR
jgi:tol-pal system protein YbgF